MKLILHILVTSLAVFVASYILPGVKVDGFQTVIIIAIVLGVLNAFLKPVLILLTLPITILTFGLFALVINAIIILFVSLIVPGFHVSGFWWALIFAIVLSLVSSFLNSFLNSDR